MQIKVTGIVLSSINVGEYDKKVTILTKEQGKIGAFMRGARKPKSELVSVTPFSFGIFDVFAGKETYYVKEASIKEHFNNILNDYDKVCQGSYFLESADYYSLEEGDELGRLALLYQTLKVLDESRIEFELIRDIFDLKTWVLNGEYPQVMECVLCTKKDSLVGFSLKHRGCLCVDCVSKEGISLNQSTVYALQYIVGKSINSVYSFTLSENCLKELTRVITGYRKSYIDHRFKSEDFIN